MTFTDLIEPLGFHAATFDFTLEPAVRRAALLAGRKR